MTNNNYGNMSPVDPVTAQKKVTIHHDMNAVLLEGESVVNGATAASAAVDIRADKDITLFVQTAKNFTLYPQYTDEYADNPNWYDLCDSTGTAVTFSCNNASKAIPLSVKAAQFRVLAKNVDSAADTPYIGVM